MLHSGLVRVIIEHIVVQTPPLARVDRPLRLMRHRRRFKLREKCNRKLLHPQVLLYPSGVHALRECDGATLNKPRDDDLRRGDVQLLSDVLNDGNVEGVLDEGTTTEGAVCLEEQAAGFSVGDELGLRVPVVQLNLVDGGLDLEVVGGQVAETSDVEAVTWQSESYSTSNLNVITDLLTPMLRTLPFLTISSSFFQVGYGSAVNLSSMTGLPFSRFSSPLKATGQCMRYRSR
jgi:hypothetical protein